MFASALVHARITYGLFDLAEFLELGAQSRVIGVPRKSSVDLSVMEL